MPAAKKTAARKSTATRTRRTREKVAPTPLEPSVQKIAAAVTGQVTESVMAAEDLGVVNVTTKQVGRRTGSGVSTTVKLDDGKKIVVTIMHTTPRPRKPRTRKPRG